MARLVCLCSRLRTRGTPIILPVSIREPTTGKLVETTHESHTIGGRDVLGLAINPLHVDLEGVLSAVKAS